MTMTRVACGRGWIGEDIRGMGRVGRREAIVPACEGSINVVCGNDFINVFCAGSGSTIKVVVAVAGIEVEVAGMLAGWTGRRRAFR